MVVVLVAFKETVVVFYSYLSLCANSDRKRGKYCFRLLHRIREATTYVRRQDVMSSDSTVEHRVLDTRTFDTIFEYSNCRVIDPSIRVFKFSLYLARI